jgi:hypothetical protein
MEEPKPMLPDYPKTKAIIAKHFAKAIKAVHDHQMGIFNSVPPGLIQEGRECIIFRDDGTSQEMAPKRLEAKSFLNLDPRRPEATTLADVHRSIWEMGSGMAAEKKRVIYETLDQELRKAGNVVGPGDPVEQFFKMVEKREFDFDERGNPVVDDFVTDSQDMANRFRDTLETIKTTPEHLDRLTALMEEKRRHFIDREAARKLVE